MRCDSSGMRIICRAGILAREGARAKQFAYRLATLLEVGIIARCLERGVEEYLIHYSLTKPWSSDLKALTNQLSNYLATLKHAAEDRPHPGSSPCSICSHSSNV